MSLLTAWVTPPAGDVALFGQTAHRTLMAWVDRTVASAGTWALEWKDVDADTGVWGFLWLPPDFHVQVRSADELVRVTIPALPGLHHLAATYDGVTVRLYVDAALAGSADLAGPIRPATAFLVRETGGLETVITDVRVYDEALDADTVALAMATPVADNPDPRPDAGSGGDGGTDPTPTDPGLAGSPVSWDDVAALMWR